MNAAEEVAYWLRVFNVQVSGGGERRGEMRDEIYYSGVKGSCGCRNRRSDECPSKKSWRE
jgi:hypothetical protein